MSNMKLTQIPSPVPNSRAYHFGECSVIVSRDECKIREILIKRWHMSISHPDRYPTWDEIKEARYKLIPDEATMAMLLPPRDSYVNVHPNCFHLWEIEEEDIG